MPYIEGEFPMVYGGGYNNNSNGWGNDGWWGIILLALLFGNRGFGWGGAGGGTGSEFVGYELGKAATQADIANGFSTSEIMSDLNQILLSQSQGFASVQQTLCQGFNGVNTAILQSANATERGFATMGFNMANGFNSVNQAIGSCCCDIRSAIADLKYANEAQTCQLLTNQNAQTQRIVDYLTNEKIESLRAENVALKGQISNNAQSRYITDTVIERLSPCPKPAYFVPNPNCCYSTFGTCSGNTITGVL